MKFFKKAFKKNRKTQVKKTAPPSSKSRPQQWTPPFAMDRERSSVKRMNDPNPIPQISAPMEPLPTYTIPTSSSDPTPKEPISLDFPPPPKSEPVKRPMRSKEQTARKEFLKTFKKLTYRWMSWDVWIDFVTMAACAISNSVDKTHFNEREELYLRAIKKYSKEEQDLFPELFAHLVMAIEENPEQDFLGEIYTELGLNSKEHRQIFTPYHVAHIMAEATLEELISQVEEKGFVTIHDCCCGAGATLIAAANVAQSKLEKVGLNSQNHIFITGQDIDRIVTMMCYIQISLLGVAGYFKVGNSLTEPMTKDDNLENYWFTPMYFFPTWTLRRLWKNVDQLVEGGFGDGEV